MGTQRAIDEVDIRRRIEAGVAAVRGGSSHGPRGCDGALRSGYRVVRHRIAASVRRSRGEAESLGGSLRDVPAPARIRGSRLTIAVGDDVAFGHSVNRISGVLKNGDKTDFWLRWTTCFRKIEGNWLIVHDQVSVPVDPQTRTALLDLGP
jgi:hypothetical protein